MNDQSYYTNKRILITGGTGYIGLSIVQALRNISCEITLTTRSSTQRSVLEHTKAKIKYLRADITEPSFWQNCAPNTDIIFHLAGQTSSSYANERPFEDVTVNVLPVIHLIEYSKKCQKKPDVIFAGTSTQIGFTESPKHKENENDLPITVYDINKLTAENYFRYYANQLDGKAVSLRLTNVYGPGPKSSKQDRGIVNLMVQRALTKKPLTIYGDGKYIRDYVYIDDVVAAFLLAGMHIDQLTGNYYLIGSGIGYTIFDMMKMIQKKVKAIQSLTVAIEKIPVPKKISQIEKRNFIADSTLFKTLTKWKVETSLEQGIIKTIEYYQRAII